LYYQQASGDCSSNSVSLKESTETIDVYLFYMLKQQVQCFSLFERESITSMFDDS